MDELKKLGEGMVPKPGSGSTDWRRQDDLRRQTEQAIERASDAAGKIRDAIIKKN